MSSSRAFNTVPSERHTLAFRGGTCGILSTVTLVLSTCGDTRVGRILCFLWVFALFLIMECETAVRYRFSDTSIKPTLDNDKVKIYSQN